MTSIKTTSRSRLAALSIATAMAVTLVAPMPVFAQTTATATEESSESQLDMSLEQFFDHHGITTEVQSLTLAQAAAIHGVVGDSSSDGEKKGQIEAIIANN